VAIEHGLRSHFAAPLSQSVQEVQRWSWHRAVTACALARALRSRDNRRESTNRLLRGDLVLLVGTTQHDLQQIVRQRPLQHLRLIPRRAHPDIALLIGSQDDRHGLGMDRFDDRVRRCGQKAIDQMRPRDRL